MKSKKLSPKEKLFCFYYSEKRNLRSAAANAGYLIYPEKTAMNLLERPEIRKEIEMLSGKSRVSANEVAAGYRRLAFGSVADSLKVLFSEQLPNDKTLEQLDMFNVSEIKMPKSGGIEIKYFDRLKALEKLQAMSELSGSEERVPFFEALERSSAVISKKLSRGEKD